MADIYLELSDEDKISLAVEFTARELRIPETLRDWLDQEGLLDIIQLPREENTDAE